MIWLKITTQAVTLLDRKIKENNWPKSFDDLSHFVLNTYDENFIITQIVFKCFRNDIDSDTIFIMTIINFVLKTPTRTIMFAISKDSLILLYAQRLL